MAVKAITQGTETAVNQPNTDTALKLKAGVGKILSGQFSAWEFETKEEYIKSLLDNSEGISKHSQKFDDDKIHLQGCLKIDRRVKSGLDWSDVVADTAVVVDGQISRYDYLPLTRQGLKSSLCAENTEQFMRHNAYGENIVGEKYILKKTFRINSTEKMPDLSNVTAERVIWYGCGKIELDCLPRAEKGFFGLSSENIITRGRDIARRARKAGLRQETLSALKQREPGLLQRLKKSLGSSKDNGTA